MSGHRTIAAVIVATAVVAAGCGTDAEPGPTAEATVARHGSGPSAAASPVTSSSTSSSTSSTVSSSSTVAASNETRPSRQQATIVTDAGTVHAELLDGRLELRVETTPGWTSHIDRTGTSATIRLSGPATSPPDTVDTVDVTIEATAHGISHRVAAHAGGDHTTWRSATETSASSGDDAGP